MLYQQYDESPVTHCNYKYKYKVRGNARKKDSVHVVGSTKPLRCFAYLSTLTVNHVVALHRNNCVQMRLQFLLSYDIFVCDIP
jgi:hypothetical protein